MGCYWVVGGLGALGIRVAGWLVDNGARHLLLTSRGGKATPEVQKQIDEFERAGVHVTVAASDISDQKNVEQTIAAHTSKAPLKGIVHSAGVLDDGVLEQQTWERFEHVMAAKTRGAWNLHEASKDLTLDFFICFSSASSLLGSPGQGNYAAANAFLDSLAHYRRSLGLPALTVNWGAWGESGMAAELDAASLRRLAAAGLGSIAPDQGLRVLGELLDSGAVQTGVFPILWPKFARQFAGTATPPFFQHVLPAASQTSEEASENVSDQFLKLPEKERGAKLFDLVEQRVASVLGFGESASLDRQATLLDLGFDSLMAVQLRNLFRTELGLDVAIGELFQSSSIEEIAGLLHNQLAFADVATGSTEAGTDEEEIEVI